MLLTQQEKQTFNDLLLKMDKEERKVLIYDVISKHDLETYQKYVNEFFDGVSVIKISTPTTTNIYAFIGFILKNEEDVYLTIQDLKCEIKPNSGGNYYNIVFKIKVIDSETFKEYVINNVFSIYLKSIDKKRFNQKLFSSLKSYGIYFLRQKGRKKKVSLK